jgi:hypothetical protein
LLNDSEEISEKFIEERGVLIIVNGLHTIITVVVKCPLQINFDLLINARDKRKSNEREKRRETHIEKGEKDGKKNKRTRGIERGEMI